MEDVQTPRFVRVSLGSAIALGLTQGSIDVMPSTVYLLTYHPEKCNANCGFCPQARLSKGRSDLLSRVTWPRFKTENVLSKIGQVDDDSVLKRVCIQAVNYVGVYEDILNLVKTLKKNTILPISVSCQPFSATQIKELAAAGINRISVPIDAATEELFMKIKGKKAGGPYSWKKQIQTLQTATKTLGPGRTSTHLIVGLGETEKEMVQTIQKMKDMGVHSGLFAFTPIKGTKLEDRQRPSLESYRRIQLARHLIIKDKTRIETMSFNHNGLITGFGVSNDILDMAVLSGEPFQTSGCPDCNRPFYNESPGGPMYNYPRKLLKEEIEEVRTQFGV